MVEKSLDGLSWRRIGKVNAAGHSDTPLSYQFFDSHPVEGLNYYRLKPTDLDGKFTYSSVVVVRYHEGSIAKIYVYPNPADDVISIVLPKFEGKATVYITDMLGHKVAEQNVNSIGGTSVSMDISKIPNGIYLVTAGNSNGNATSRLVKTSK